MRKIYTAPASEFRKELEEFKEKERQEMQERQDLKDIYRQDTVGKKIHTPIVSPTKTVFKAPSPAEIVQANIYSPIERKTFFKLSDDAKKRYVSSLREKYSVTDTAICKMIGCDRSGFSKLCKKLGIAKGKGELPKPTVEQQKAWLEFTSKGETKPEETHVPVLASDPVIEQPIADKESLHTTCNLLKLEFAGTPNLVGFVELAEKMFSSLDDCDVQITITRR